MAYEIVLTENAASDIKEFVAYLREKLESEETIDRWSVGLFRTIATLNEMPERCPFVPERPRLPYPYRQLRYASHRIVFRVEKDTVFVSRIYHGSRRRLR